MEIRIADTKRMSVAGILTEWYEIWFDDSQ